MKKYSILFLCMIITGAMIVISCNKDDDEDPKDTNLPEMSAIIDGESWSATQMGFSIVEGSTIITGLNDQLPHISITLDGLSEETFILEDDPSSAILISEIVTFSTLSYPEAGGTLTVTSINTTDSLISGTFDFIAVNFSNKNIVSVTDGVFKNIPVSDVLFQLPDNSFSCNFAGMGYIAETINVSVFNDYIIMGTSNELGMHSIQLYIDSSVEPGEHEFGTEWSSIYAHYNKYDGTHMVSTTGTLIITEHDHQLNILEGTFDFYAEDEVGMGNYHFQNGYFKISY